MIVKNEEEVLQQCLNSVNDLCDEIIIVDTGSTDKTKDIAKQFTEKVFGFEWIDDFSAARNFATGAIGEVNIAAYGDFVSTGTTTVAAKLMSL